MRVILASQSPRRKMLLSRLGRMLSFGFEVIAPAIVEETKAKRAQAHTRILARKKASAVYAHLYTHESALADHSKSQKQEKNKPTQNAPYLIIGADTVVSLKNEILEKPQSPEDAYKMICRLSGRKHEVVSSVCLLFPPHTKPLMVSDSADVVFKKLSKDTVHRYCEWDDWKDYAGGYNIDSLGACLIERIEGHVATVMGLPIHKLYDLLLRSFSQ